MRASCEQKNIVRFDNSFNQDYWMGLNGSDTPHTSKTRNVFVIFLASL